MERETTGLETSCAKSLENRNWPGTILLSPLLWGGLLTVGFYRLIPVLPVQRELAERYFCNHPLEYACPEAATFSFDGLIGSGLAREPSNTAYLI